MENNSIKNKEPYSSIILQQDNLNYVNFFQNRDSSEQFMQQDQLSESQHHLQEIKEQEIENMISDANHKIMWLESFINNGSSKMSNKISDNSKSEGPGFNLAHEQWNQENLLNQQDLDQTINSDAKNTKLCSLEQLKEVQALLKKLLIALKENQENLILKETEIVKLKQQIFELNILLTRKERLNRAPKQKGKTQEIQTKYSKKSNIQKDDGNDYFIKIQKECDAMIQICTTEYQNKKQTDKAKQSNSFKDDQFLKQKTIQKIQNSSEKICVNAQKLKNQINQIDEQSVIFQTQAYDYKIFILMGMLDKEYLPTDQLQLRQENIEEMWEQLTIPIHQQENHIIKIIKYQQESYFMKDNSNDPYTYLNQRFQNQLSEIIIHLDTILKVQDETLKQIKIDEKKKKSSIKKVIEIQQSGLQQIEKPIEKNILEIKNNIKYIIANFA